MKKAKTFVLGVETTKGCERCFLCLASEILNLLSDLYAAGFNARAYVDPDQHPISDGLSFNDIVKKVRMDREEAKTSSTIDLLDSTSFAEMMFSYEHQDNDFYRANELVTKANEIMGFSPENSVRKIIETSKGFRNTPLVRNAVISITPIIEKRVKEYRDEMTRELTLFDKSISMLETL